MGESVEGLGPVKEENGRFIWRVTCLGQDTAYAVNGLSGPFLFSETELGDLYFSVDDILDSVAKGFGEYFLY